MKKFFSCFQQIGMFGMLFAALPLTSQGQVSFRDINRYLKKRDDGKNVSMYHRYELGYGVTFGSGALNLNDRFRDQSNNNIIGGTSRSTTFNYRTWTVHASTYFPLSYLSENSMLAISAGFLGIPTVFELGNLSLDPSRTSTYEAADLFFGAPVGVDYIFGGEATMNKADKFTLRAGGGLIPYFAAGELADGSNDYAKLGIKPYVKAELGFFLAVEWKIKGMAVLGSRTIYDIKQGDYNLGDSDYYYSMNLKIRPTFTIGIAVMPFSFGWESDKW